jgi:hypothetical protein
MRLFEEEREALAKQFLSRVAEDKDSLGMGVDMLATIDPVAAAELDNAMKNIRQLLESIRADSPVNDAVRYIEVITRHNDVIDWTLLQFEEMAEKLAKRSGPLQKRRIGKWFAARRQNSQSGDGTAFRKRMGPKEGRPLKLTISGYTPEQLRRTFSDVIEWDKAKWAATVFAIPKHGVPKLGIGFADFEAGKGILARWIKEIGPTDVADKIGVSIVEGPIAGEPDGYTVMLFYDAKPIDNRSAHLHRMISADDAPNLQKFKQRYFANGEYDLFPAHVDRDTVLQTDFSLCIRKRRLRFVDSATVTPNQVEYLAIKPN